METKEEADKEGRRGGDTEQITTKMKHEKWQEKKKE